MIRAINHYNTFLNNNVQCRKNSRNYINFNGIKKNEQINSSSYQFSYPNQIPALYLKNKVNINFKGNFQKGTYEWAENWDELKRKEELEEEKRLAIKKLSFWKRHFTDRPQEIAQSCRETLARERIMVTTLLQNSSQIQNKIDIETQLKAENQAMRADIEKREATLSKWANASQIASAFRQNMKGNLDEQIAGYDSEKMIIRNKFSDQIAAEQAGMEEGVKIPNSILLYGAIGTGKTTFARAAAAETGSKLVEINPEPKKFGEVIQEKLNEARDRYIQTGQRTVILVNEADIHLSEDKENRKNIALMKNYLDNCAAIPTEDTANAYATTFFFTTNRPMDITDEILLREEKIGAIIALEPAEGDNIRDILQFYMQKCDPDKNSIDWERFDYDKYIKKLNPDDKKGAYGNDKLKSMLEAAFYAYKNNDSKTFDEYLDETIGKTTRNIRPNRLNQYRQDLVELCGGNQYGDNEQ